MDWQKPTQEYVRVEAEFRSPTVVYELALQRWRECMEHVDVTLPELGDVLAPVPKRRGRKV